MHCQWSLYYYAMSLYWYCTCTCTTIVIVFGGITVLILILLIFFTELSFVPDLFHLPLVLKFTMLILYCSCLRNEYSTFTVEWSPKRNKVELYSTVPLDINNIGNTLYSAPGYTKYHAFTVNC